MAEREVETIGGLQLDLVVPEGMRAEFVDQIGVTGTPTTVVLSFFQSNFPITSPSDGKVQATCLSRLVLTHDVALRLAEFINAHVGARSDAPEPAAG